MLYDGFGSEGVPGEEAENRLRNLMWTISGDYALDTKLDVESYERSKYISLYDAVKQGAFARFYDKNAFALYLVKKVYCGADERPLTELAQLCVDTASYRRIAEERPGVPELRNRAFSDLLEDSFHRMSATLPGRIKIALMKNSLYGNEGGEKQVRESVARILKLENAYQADADVAEVSRNRHSCGCAAETKHTTTTMDIIRTVDVLYNSLIDKSFERKHGGLEQVLSVTLEELREFDWGDFLKEEISEDALDQYFNQMNQAVTTLREEADEEPEEPKQAKHRVLLIDEKAAAKMYSYMELNFGRSYLTKREQEQKNLRLCRGAHADCSLYFTEGILENTVLKNAQYVNARRYAEKNKVHFQNNRLDTIG